MYPILAISEWADIARLRPCPEAGRKCICSADRAVDIPRGLLILPTADPTARWKAFRLLSAMSLEDRRR